MGGVHRNDEMSYMWQHWRTIVKSTGCGSGCVRNPFPGRMHSGSHAAGDPHSDLALRDRFARSPSLEPRGALPLYEGGHAAAGAGRRESGRRVGEVAEHPERSTKDEGAPIAVRLSQGTLHADALLAMFRTWLSSMRCTPCAQQALHWVHSGAAYTSVPALHFFGRAAHTCGITMIVGAGQPSAPPCCVFLRT